MKERIFTTKEQGRVLVEAGLPILGYNKRYNCPWTVVYRSKDKYYTCMKYDTEFETYPPEEYEYLYP